MYSTITILSREVIDDIRSAAWLESETHPGSNLHQRHEMADVCEKDNVERVWRILGLCDAEIRLVLRKILSESDDTYQRNDLLTPDEWFYDFKCRLPPHTASLLKEKIHEYMVSRVMADRLEIFIPEAVLPWKQRASEAMSALSTAAQTTSLLTPARRPLSPF
ncbi:MAG: hypothetical protein NC095_11285 [Muribaculum sp.]|nr:hypothetical protein [Muribaculum sp.]